MTTKNPHWQIVINPLAGGRKAHRRLSTLPQLLRRLGIAHTLRQTQYAGHATEIAAEAQARGYSHFVSAGGDGTHHEVINGLMSSGVRSGIPTLALIPIGTGNDWARAHHIPHDPAKAAMLLQTGAPRPIPVGKIQFGTGKLAYFANAVGMGLDAEVVKAVSRDAVRRYGKGAYIFTALKHLFRYRPLTAVLKGPDIDRHDAFVTIHAGFGRYVGGGMEFLPHGDPYGDQLALLTITGAPRLELLVQMYRLFNGSIRAYRGAWHARSGTVEIMDGGIPILVEADGELLGTTPVAISVVPEAMRLITPSVQS